MTKGASSTHLTKKDFIEFYSLMSLLVEENDEFFALVNSHYLTLQTITTPKKPFNPNFKIEESPLNSKFRKDQHESKIVTPKITSQRKDQEVSFNVFKQS